jgi:hypothetical protein
MQVKLIFYTLLLPVFFIGMIQSPLKITDDFQLCNSSKIYAVNDYLYGNSYFKDYEKLNNSPRAVGGKDSLAAYFDRSVKLAGDETQIVARYHIIFIVNCKGDVGRFELKSKEFPGYNKIMEACKHMPKWLPAKKANNNVDCYVRLGFTNRVGKLILDYREE